MDEFGGLRSEGGGAGEVELLGGFWFWSQSQKGGAGSGFVREGKGVGRRGGLGGGGREGDKGQDGEMLHVSLVRSFESFRSNISLLGAKQGGIEKIMKVVKLQEGLK